MIEELKRWYKEQGRPCFNDSIGGRKSFELHHKEVQHGGKVYDVDNIGVVTPRHHIDTHKGLK